MDLREWSIETLPCTSGSWLFWGRFKTENAEVLLACDTLVEVASVIDDRLAYYNRARHHSALDYKHPEEVLLSTLKGGSIAEES